MTSVTEKMNFKFDLTLFNLSSRMFGECDPRV